MSKEEEEKKVISLMIELGFYAAFMQSPDCGLRIFKPGVQPEDFEQYLR